MAQAIESRCSAHDYDEPGKPAIDWNDKDAREQLVDALVSDAHRLLGHLPEQNLGPRAAEAVALLALIVVQDVEPIEGSDDTDGHWCIAQKVAPDRIMSTVDPETRRAHTTVHRRQDGFKARITIEPDTGIITDFVLTRSSGPDNHEAVVGLALLDGEHTPVRVLGGSAYDTGEATSPAGHTANITANGGVKFEKCCRSCPLAAQCATAKRGRCLTISDDEYHLRTARAIARTPEWKAESPVT